MCGGGGGGDGGAADRESARQSRIRSTVSRINELFADPGREQQYGEHRQDVYDLNLTELDRQGNDAKRQLGFALARAGLSGGSGDVYSHERLQNRYNEGLMRVGDTANSASAKLRDADERTKLNLISQAQAGMDATTASQSALDAMRTNADIASSQNKQATLGDLFAGIAQFYYAGQQPTTAQNQPSPKDKSRFSSTYYAAPSSGGSVVN